MDVNFEAQATARRRRVPLYAIVALVGFAVVLAGALFLVATRPPSPAASAANCKSSSGATCSGEVCCADANACYTSCEGMVRAHYPAASGDDGPDGPGRAK